MCNLAAKAQECVETPDDRDVGRLRNVVMLCQQAE